MFREVIRKPLFRQTALDRVISWVSPAAGIERAKARATLDQATGYKGAKRGRRATKRWGRGQGGSANTDTLPEAADLRERSRDLVRNMPVATGAVSTMVTHTVGVGLSPAPAIDREVLGLSDEEADELETALEREFNHWAEESDYQEKMSFWGQQELAFRSALESGDCFGVKRVSDNASARYATRIQLIEADRVSNPRGMTDTDEVAGGIRFDAIGRPVGVYVSDRHPGNYLTGKMPSAWELLPMRTVDGRPLVMHVADYLRPEQARGIPYLAPVIEALKELSTYTEAELRAAVVSGLFAVFIETDPAYADGTTAADEIGEQDDGSDDLKIEEGGSIYDLAPGRKANSTNPGRPNEKFDPFVTSVLRQVGVALDLPLELLIKHFTASYSASRAALEMAAMSFTRRRRWFVRAFCQPCYEMVIEEAVARGRIRVPGFFRDPMIRRAVLGTDWIGPQRIILDPLKEANADEKDLKNEVKTKQQVCRERTGGDWSRKSRQIEREDRDRQSRGRGASAAEPPPSDDEPDEEIVTDEEEEEREE